MDIDKREYNQAYYQKHRKRILKKNAAYERRRLARDPAFRETKRAQARKYQAKRRAKIKGLIRAAKDVPCTDCRVKYPPEIMDLDHVRGKSFELCAVVQGRVYATLDEIVAEIAKCDPRCPTCHRMRHYREGNLDAADDLG